MFKSITTKVIVLALALVILVNVTILIGITQLLPTYFVNDQLDKIKNYTRQIEENFDQLSDSEKSEFLYGLQIEMGGDLYTTGNTKGHGFGKHNVMRGNPTLQGDYQSQMYTNSLGHEVYTFVTRLETGLLVYEVSVHSLKGAVDVMTNFMMVLLVITIAFGFVLALVLAKNITRPIKSLNQLALSMRTKEAEAKMVTNGQDEIAELNRSLNSMYEELLANIYHLESELEHQQNEEALRKRFLAQATHELKTPIAVIQGYSELIEDGMYSSIEEKDTYINNIYQETKNVTAVMHDILDYSTFSRTVFETNLVETDTLALFKNIGQKMKGICEHEGKRFEMSLPDEKLLLKIDPLRIEQAIKNLLSNAIEHSDALVKFNVTILGDTIKCSIYNSGKLINEADLPYVFDSFYKASGKKKGTGLGLAIVKEIMKEHGGDYRVENKIHGVEFTITLKK